MIAAIALAIFLVTMPAAAQDYTLLPLLSAIDGAPVQAVLAPDAIPAIDDPRFVSGPVAERQMARDEFVLGLRLGGVARAYPLGFLSSHEIVNDRLADTSVAVTW